MFGLPGGTYRGPTPLCPQSSVSSWGRDTICIFVFVENLSIRGPKGQLWLVVVGGATACNIYFRRHITLRGATMEDKVC